ncbi:MAG TPA: diaminopimelate decarboxylase [Streptosporangiaceae bacterium]|jgi:diaminopimelate decarboxylase|nr:diaminopimelate decarboxylase [Streptosporangiaceae bacterium]
MTDLSLLPPSAVIDGADLRIGGCSLTELAAEFGTPAFIIDEPALRDRARAFAGGLAARHPRSRVCFATKSFPSASMISVLASEGLGLDVVGAGELHIALAAGADPAGIVMHGNAKSDADIRAALDAEIGYIIVDGMDDIERIDRLARRPTPVLLRVSPGIESHTHAALATGGKASKFGVPVEQVPDALARMQAAPMIRMRGLHAHIGSQIVNLQQFEAEVAALATLGEFEVYDLGGGLGVRYEPGDVAPTIDEYLSVLVDAVHRYLPPGIELIIEPGRSLVAPVGVTLYRVLTMKQSGLLHVAVDGGMGDNLEYPLYGQRFTPLVIGRWDEPQLLVDLVGRHCEAGDIVTPAVMLRSPQLGDLVVVPVTGAYCFTMVNNYNGALRPPVIYCSDGRARLGVRRETTDELLARELTLAAAARPA